MFTAAFPKHEQATQCVTNTLLFEARIAVVIEEDTRHRQRARELRGIVRIAGHARLCTCRASTGFSMHVRRLCDAIRVSVELLCWLSRAEIAEVKVVTLSEWVHAVRFSAVAGADMYLVANSDEERHSPSSLVCCNLRPRLVLNGCAIHCHILHSAFPAQSSHAVVRSWRCEVQSVCNQDPSCDARSSSVSLQCTLMATSVKAAK